MRSILLPLLILLIMPLAYINVNADEEFSYTYKIMHKGKAYEIPYTIENAKIESIKIHEEFESIIISLFDNEKDGFLELTLARELVTNTKWGEINDPIVLVDNKEEDIEVIHKDNRTITIRFDLPAKTKIVEIVKMIVLSTSSLSLDLSDYWIGRGDTLNVNVRFYDLKTDAERVEFEVKIVGPLPKNNEVFSEFVNIQNNGNLPLPIRISEYMESGRYNIEISPVNKTVTTQQSFTTFTVRGAGFVPMNIEYIVSGTRENERLAYADTKSLMFLDTNSSQYGWYSFAEKRTVEMRVVGDNGTKGYMLLVIPRDVMDGINEVEIIPRKNSEYSIDTNSTHTMIEMNYPHTGKETLIIIRGATMIPEFPVAFIVLVTSITGLIAVNRFLKKVK